MKICNLNYKVVTWLVNEGLFESLLKTKFPFKSKILSTELFSLDFLAFSTPLAELFKISAFERLEKEAGA